MRRKWLQVLWQAYKQVYKRSFPLFRQRAEPLCSHLKVVSWSSLSILSFSFLELTHPSLSLPLSSLSPSLISQLPVLCLSTEIDVGSLGSTFIPVHFSQRSSLNVFILLASLPQPAHLHFFFFSSLKLSTLFICSPKLKMMLSDWHLFLLLLLVFIPKYLFILLAVIFDCFYLLVFIPDFVFILLVFSFLNMCSSY